MTPTWAIQEEIERGGESDRKEREVEERETEHEDKQKSKVLN